MQTQSIEATNYRVLRGTLSDEVAHILRERIYAHELPPGAWVDEQALAEQCGVSRTPMREAIKLLAAEGLIRLEPRKGGYVASISDKDLDEIFPIMAELEGFAAKEAVARLDAKSLERLQTLHNDLERSVESLDVDRFFEVNQAFHTAIHEISGNPRLAQMIADTRKLINLARRDSLASSGRLKQSLGEHRLIMKAIEKREPEKARTAMHNHLISGRSAIATRPAV